MGRAVVEGVHEVTELGLNVLLLLGVVFLHVSVEKDAFLLALLEVVAGDFLGVYERRCVSLVDDCLDSALDIEAFDRLYVEQEAEEALEGLLWLNTKVLVPEQVGWHLRGNILDDLSMVDLECLGCFSQELIPDLWNILGKVFVNDTLLIERWEEVHDGRDSIKGIADAANGFMALVRLVVVIPLWIVALLDPHRRVGDLLGFEVLELQVDVELKAHV